jgi:hypothetical protein
MDGVSAIGNPAYKIGFAVSASFPSSFLLPGFILVGLRP